MRDPVRRAGVLAAALLCLASAARAEPPPAAAETAPQPAAAAAATPAEVLPPFRSALSDYRRHEPDETLRDWRGANDEVGRLRGHGGHLQPPPKTGGGSR